jgi:hypothetical protein
MTEEEFEIILAEVRQLRRAIAGTVHQIVHQQGEIQALRWVLEHKGLATAEELDVASDEGAWQLRQTLDKPESGDPEDTPSRFSIVQGRPKASLCRERHRRPLPRGSPPY